MREWLVFMEASASQIERVAGPSRGMLSHPDYYSEPSLRGSRFLLGNHVLLLKNVLCIRFLSPSRSDSEQKCPIGLDKLMSYSFSLAHIFFSSFSFEILSLLK